MSSISTRRSISMRRFGRASVRGLISGRPNAAFDPTVMSNFRWRGGGYGKQGGKAMELLQNHPRIMAATGELQTAASSAPWQLRPCHVDSWGNETGADESPQERELREQIEQVLQSMTVDWHGTDGSRPRGTWRTWLGEAFATRFHWGASVYERTWYHDVLGVLGADGRRAVLELYPINPNSWDTWEPVRVEESGTSRETGMIAYLRQRTQDGGTVDIPGERLVHLPWRAMPGQHEGLGAGLSLVFLYEVAVAALENQVKQEENKGALLVRERHGAGTTGGNKASVKRWMQRESNGRTWVYVPPGYEIEALMDAVAGLDAVEQQRVLDAAIDQVYMRTAASLGVTAGSGSRALGETLRAEDNAIWRDTLNVHGEQVSAELFSLLRRDLGWSPALRLPKLWVPPTEDEALTPEALATALQSFGSMGLAVSSPRLIEHVGRTMRLPDDVIEEQVRMLLAPRPTLPDAAVAPTTPTAPLSTAPEPAATNATDVLERYRGLAELRKAGEPVSVLRAAAIAIGIDPETVAPLTPEGGEAKILPVGSIQAALDITERVSSGALAAEAAMVLYRAAGIPEDQARELADRARTVTPPATAVTDNGVASASPSPVARFGEEPGGCGCGGCSTTLRTQEPILGADGRAIPWTVRRPLAAEETVIRWAENEDARETADRALAQTLNALASEHEGRIFSLGTPIDLAAADAIALEYQERYRQALATYAADLQQQVIEQARGELQRQAAERPGPSVGAGPDEEAREMLRAWVVSQSDLTRTEMALAARAIAGRVQGAAVRAAASGIAPTAFESGRTEASLVYDARAVGNRVESAQRIEAATTLAPPGYAVTGTTRSGVRNADQCDECAPPRDGKFWPLTTPAEVQAFIDDPDAQAPDPRCRGNIGGRQRCRCGHIPRIERIGT